MENNEFYYMEHARWVNGQAWISAATRDEFIEKNRNELIVLFGGEERAKKLCYGFK